MEYKCCSLSFYDLHTYLKRLKFHSENSNLQVKYNTCGHTSKIWIAFREHITTEHPEEKFTYLGLSCTE